MNQIELFNHLIYLKAFNCVQTINSNIQRHLIECKQMNSGLFKNVTNKLFVYRSYIFKIYMYKQDLALNNLQ